MTVLTLPDKTTLASTVLPHGGGAGAKTRTILTDGERFFCGYDGCLFHSDAWASVFAHRAVHSPRRKQASVSASIAVTLGIEIAALDAQLQRETKVKDSWRDRALVAERNLRSVQRAMATVGARS